jgi:hypothetical protein
MAYWYGYKAADVGACTLPELASMLTAIGGDSDESERTGQNMNDALAVALEHALKKGEKKKFQLHELLG